MENSIKNKYLWIWHLIALLVPIVIYAVLLNITSFADLGRSWAGSGDGMKNLFSFIDYVRNGDAFYINGVNYPYGEFIPFTDNMPIVAVVTKFINDHIISIEGYELTIHNAIIFFQWVLSGYVFFLVFRQLKLYPIFAILSATCILLLSPQIHRINAHFSLSFILVISLFFYAQLKLLLSKKYVKQGTLLFVLIVVSTLIHVYYLLLFLIYGGFFLLMVFIKKEKKVFWTMVVALFAGTILSFSLIKGLDNRYDRAKIAGGYGSYNANFVGVFYPQYGKSKEIVYKITKSKLHPNVEAKNYLGVQNIFFLIISLILSIVTVFRKRESKLFVLKEPFVYIFWPAVFCWIYSLGVFTDLQKFLFPSLHTPLDQFRSLGRVMWMGYYGISICTLSWIYHKCQQNISQQKLGIGVALALTSFSIWSLEGLANTKPETKVIKNRVEPVVFESGDELKSILAKHSLSKENFQATLTLPLTIIGSEKINGEIKTTWFLNYNYLTRLELGIPCISLALSRTSIKQACNLAQLVSDEYIEKTRVDDMDERDILLFEADEGITARDKRLIEKSEYLGAFGQVKVYRLPIVALEHKIISQDSIITEMELMSTCDKFISDDCFSFVFYESPNINGVPKFPVEEHLKDVSDVFDLDVTKFINKKMELSAWYNISMFTEGGPYPIIELIDEKGETIWKKHFAHSTNFNYINNWRKISTYVDLITYKKAIKLRHSFETHDHPIKNILLQEFGKDVLFPISDSVIWRNNNFLVIKN